MRADPNLQFLVLKPEPKSLNDFIQMLKQIFLNLSFVINGHIGFGDGTLPDNVDGNWVNVTTPVAPNTDFTVDHNLGRLPVGYVPMQKDRAVDIYTGSVPSTKTQLTLRATVASALIRLFIVCLVLAIPTFGQSTSVTVNVTDSSGQVWIGGNYKIGFWTNPSFPNGYQWQGAPFNQTTIFTGVMDGSGNFTVSIPDNSTISPSGSAWKFTVCPLATFPCFDQVIGVSGASQSLSIVPPPILISPTAVNSSYQTTQSKAGLGALMYKITDGHLYVCTASAPYRVDPSESCTGGSSWVPLCEPGDGLCGGGTGCTLSGINLGVVSEHPLGTCFDSIKFTWDADREIMLAGDGATTVNSPFGEVYSFGDSNVLKGSILDVFGDSVILKGDNTLSLGSNSTYNTLGLGLLQDSILLEHQGTINLGGLNSDAFDVEILGSDDDIEVGNPLGGNVNQVHCIHGVGGHNRITITGGLSSTVAVQKITWAGKDNVLTATGHGMNEINIVGNSNIFNATSAALNIAAVFGNSLTLQNCLDCYAIGESIVNSTSNTLAMGMSVVPELVISTNQVTLKKLAFSFLPACAAGTEGSMMPVTDSTTNTWGATVTGGSTNHILAYCDGTNWTVAAK